MLAPAVMKKREDSRMTSRDRVDFSRASFMRSPRGLIERVVSSRLIIAISTGISCWTDPVVVTVKGVVRS